MGLASAGVTTSGVGGGISSSASGVSATLHGNYGLSSICAMQTGSTILPVDADGNVFLVIAGVGVEGRPRSVSLSSVETDDNDQDQGGNGRSRPKEKGVHANATASSSGTSPK